MLGKKIKRLIPKLPKKTFNVFDFLAVTNSQKAVHAKPYADRNDWLRVGQNKEEETESRRGVGRMNQKYQQYGKLLSIEPHLDSFVVIVNQNVLDSINTAESKIEGRERLTRTEYAKQKEVLQKTFPGVEIVEDDNLPVIGRLMPGGTEIRVNPKLWTTDTLGHEFGHLLIDLIGGLKNSLVKAGLRFLDGTDLQKKVYDAYPELVEREDDRVDKELIAQALGMDAAKIFDEQDRPLWERWKMRLFRRIRQLLGLESRAVYLLAKRLVKGVPLTEQEIQDSPSRYSQSQKITDKSVLDEQEAPTTNVESVRQKAIEALQKKIAIHKGRGTLANLKSIEDAVEFMEKTKSPLLALRAFYRQALFETRNIYQEVLIAERNERRGDPDAFNAQTLHRWKEYLAAYAPLQDMVKLLISLQSAPIVPGDTKRPAKTKAINRMIEAINTVSARKISIEEMYKDKGIPIIAKYLAPHSQRIAIEYKRELERKWNNLSKKEQEETPLDEFQERYLELNSDRIQERTEQMLQRELLKAQWDIGVLGRWIDNIIDSPDPVVAAMVTAFEKTDDESLQAAYNQKHRMLKALKRLEKQQPLGIRTDPKEYYSFMLEKSKKGRITNHLVSPHLSEMFDLYNVKVMEWENDPTISEQAVRIKKKAWKDTNMPRQGNDLKDYNKAKEEYLNKQVKDGLISETEKSRIEENERNRGTSAWVDITDPETALVKSRLFVEKWMGWLFDNSWNFRTPAPKWRNAQWGQLLKIAGWDGKTSLTTQQQLEFLKANKSKDARVDFYLLIKDMAAEADSWLNYRFRRRGKLPAITKDLLERKQSGQKLSVIAREEMRIGLVKRPEDIEKGQTEIVSESKEPVLFVPVFYAFDLDEAQKTKLRQDYVSKLKRAEKRGRILDQTEDEYVAEKFIPGLNQSYDVATIYQRYWAMAKDYNLKTAILPEMEMARFLVASRDVVKADLKGKPIRDALAKNKEKTLTKKGAANMVFQQLGDWFESTIYGRKEKDEGTLFGGRIDKAKAGNLLNKYTAFNLLGLNMVQGVANVILGQTLEWAEAFGGEFYNAKDFLKAGQFYGKNTFTFSEKNGSGASILGDIGAREPGNIVNLINQRFNTLNEYENGEYRKNSKFAQLLNSNTLFFTTYAGEHYMQSRVVLAMLNRMKAKDKNGKVIGTMLENLEVRDGRMETKEGVANFDKAQQT